MRYNAAMTLTRKDVQRIADLAHLRLSDAETDIYTRQLESILEYAARLRSLDTSAIAPTTTVLPMQSNLRSDEPKDSLPHEIALANSPQPEREMFVIPPVFE